MTEDSVEQFIVDTLSMSDTKPFQVKGFCATENLEAAVPANLRQETGDLAGSVLMLMEIDDADALLPIQFLERFS